MSRFILLLIEAIVRNLLAPETMENRFNGWGKREINYSNKNADKIEIITLISTQGHTYNAPLITCH